jgi:hypothetical protein
LVLLPVVAAAGGRVVAIGDVHGSFSGLTTILAESGLIDADLHWTGGDATLVQTGDLLDRGVDVREVVELLMRLQAEAADSGGRVEVLLGNHETMNLTGIYRDVNQGAYERFVDDGSERRRRQGLSSFKKLVKRRARSVGQSVTFTDEAEQQWLALHPPGLLEYAEAFGPDGRYGAWLRSRPVALVVDGTLFLHGGYGPHLEGMTVAEVNSKVSEELSTFYELRTYMAGEGLALPWSSLPEAAAVAKREVDEFEAAGSNAGSEDPTSPRHIAHLTRLLGWRDWLLFHPEGPLWFRGAANWDEFERGDEVVRLLDGLGVARMVVGHTPQTSSGITARFDDRVFLIDTGMLAPVYGGRPAALEISDGTVSAVYPGERQVLSEPPPTSEIEAAPSSVAEGR